MRVLFAIYFVLLIAYSIFSYSLTDPNLVLTSFNPYWQFQQYMWQAFFENRVLLTWGFSLLVGALFITYFFWLSKLRYVSDLGRRKVLWYFLLISPLIISYNALSHDVFNYIFNAKMIVVYGDNPHHSVALNYASIDDWTRFMHNTHTTAPYGYGWTVLSLIPYILGFHKFLSTWIFFKLFSVASVALLYLVLQKINVQLSKTNLSPYQLGLVFLNPLFLLEIISNAHNDLWMMVPALASLYILLNITQIVPAQRFKYFLASMALWFLSITIKWATIVLFPVFAIVVSGQLGILTLSKKLHQKLFLSADFFRGIIEPFTRKIYIYFPAVASLLLFLPLVTGRSQQFHPWYLTWVLVWLPWVKPNWWRDTTLLFSLTSLYRYVPWLINGEYSQEIFQQQKLVTWTVPLGLVTWTFFLGVQKLLRTEHKWFRLSRGS